MALKDDDDHHQTQASEPLLTDVERVEVVAPAELPEGYGLEVTTTNEENGQTSYAQVIVPEGGVSEGERFTAQPQYMDIPNDRWRDGILNCLQFGLTHPALCTGLFCCPIPLAQVMTRMHLNWIGDYRDPDSNPARLSTFKVVMVIFTIYLVGLYVTSANLLEEMIELPLPIFLPMSWWDFLLWVYCFVLVMKTRSYVRRKYSIPETHCHGCEDCCCAFFCLQLTVCQMARHTADYDTYRAAVCTENGLPQNAPEIV